MSDVWEDARKSGGEESVEVFPSPVSGKGPALTWFQFVQILLVVGGLAATWTTITMRLDTQAARIDALQQAVVRMDNKLDDYTKAVIAATARPSTPRQ